MWKKEIEAWTVGTELRKEKQAVAVMLNLPGDNIIKQKALEELTLEELNSENGLSILFEFLDKHLLRDNVRNCLNKFEEFENFERAPKENIRDYVSQFDYIFCKLEKVKVRLPPELKAFKMLGKANITKEQRMIILAQVNYADKENFYEEMKTALLRFGDLDGSLGMGNLKLEPAWRKTPRGHGRKWYSPYGKIGQLKKKLNPVGVDGKVLLCSSCGSYRHLVAQCPDSWENMEKRGKVFDLRKCGTDSGVFGDRNSISDKDLRAERKGKLVNMCNAQEVPAYVIKLKQEIQNLKGEIMDIKAAKQNGDGTLANLPKLEDGVQGSEASMTIKDIHQRLSYLEEGRKDIDDIKYDSNTTRTTVKELRKKMSLQKAEIAQQQKIDRG